MLLSHALSQHSVTSTNKFLLRVRPAPLRVPAPPSKCRYLQPARVNPPGAGLLCLLRKRMEAERWRLLFPETNRQPSVSSCLQRTIFCDSGHLQHEHRRPDMQRK